MCRCSVSCKTEQEPWAILSLQCRILSIVGAPQWHARIAGEVHARDLSIIPSSSRACQFLHGHLFLFHKLRESAAVLN